MSRPTVECHCVNVAMGSYDNQVSMKTPDDKWVCIDTCIATAIGWLWHRDVVTLNSCCGHGNLDPTVIVSPLDVLKMERLGFDQADDGSVVPEQTFRLGQTPLMTERTAAERWADLATRSFKMSEVFEILDHAVADDDDDETAEEINEWLDHN